MSADHDQTAPAAPGAFKRAVFVSLGVLSVGVGGIGIVVPGLPTTVFLLVASYCFSKSCPALTDRWLRRGVFAPYMRYADEGRPMPFHARVIALGFMWTGTAFAVRAWASPWADAAILVAAGIGSVAVLLVRRPSSAGCPVLGLADSLSAPARPTPDSPTP